MINAKTKILVLVSMVLSLGSAYGMKGPNKPAPQCSGGMCGQKQVSARYGRILALAKNSSRAPKAPSHAAQGGQEEAANDGPGGHQQVANRVNALPPQVVDQVAQGAAPEGINQVVAQQAPLEPILAQAVVPGPQEDAPVQLGAPLQGPAVGEPLMEAEFVIVPAGNGNNEVVPVAESFGQRFMAGLGNMYYSAKSSVEDLIKKARE